MDGCLPVQVNAAWLDGSPCRVVTGLSGDLLSSAELSEIRIYRILSER